MRERTGGQGGQGTEIMIIFADMFFVDTHTHFNDEAFAGDANEAVARAVEAGVGKMMQADIDSSERDGMWKVSEAHPGVLYNMVGLYPGSVREDWQEEIDRMLPYRERGVVAMGEIGLDYHEGKEWEKEQKEALRVQLELAAQWDLPVNIHLRDAWPDFLAVLKDCAHLHLRGNLHCYSGSVETYTEANRWADMMIGVGGVVTFRNASLQGVVAKLPIDRILLETDAPYLAPVPHRGTRNESSYIPLIAAKVAEIKGLTLEETARATTSNAMKLFNLQ